MNILRYLLGIGFSAIGVLHFTREQQFRNIIPKCLPLRKTAVIITGVFEILFGLALLIKKPSQCLKNVINLFLLAVFPANIYMAVKKLPLGDKQLPTWQLYLRLPMQFVLMGIIKKL
ncbi:TPA: hypothetical protein RRM88_002314 [Staphylococcus argenteus]|uniref:DoxX family protein n=1 Tax=Staphylococcus argenteus TaxID=985002 RepID=UPI000508D4D2|nr:membrane protein [Staphylococcus argenteus]MBE2136481.1 hypothetical protein [Staphylococcus argenteus]MCG9855592.1 hypothetical protein [Staphylococcus argenteus]MDR7651043.1 hypothetical protein [Staphylococcus argenteus]MDR7683740.1 hypothetical protein [Staphylococcus argenteus]MDT3006283.1 hypothetical protein [Staphylococcus argenteus]